MMLRRQYPYGANYGGVSANFGGISAAADQNLQKHEGNEVLVGGNGTGEFWHFGGLSAESTPKHGEFAAFCRELARALYARIMAESFG